jgi:hypothetical protein
MTWAGISGAQDSWACSENESTDRLLTAEIGKILFVENLVGEKRRERLHIGGCRGTRKLVIPWVRLGSGFYSLFALPAGRRCLSDANRLFLGRRSVSLTTYRLLGPPAVCPSIPSIPNCLWSNVWEKVFSNSAIIPCISVPSTTNRDQASHGSYHYNRNYPFVRRLQNQSVGVWLQNDSVHVHSHRIKENSRQEKHFPYFSLSFLFNIYITCKQVA